VWMIFWNDWRSGEAKIRLFGGDKN